MKVENFNDPPTYVFWLLVSARGRMDPGDAGQKVQIRRNILNVAQKNLTEPGRKNAPKILFIIKFF
jgi:hypothetical protein